VPQEGLPEPSAYDHPAGGFISEAAFDEHMTGLRERHRGFRTSVMVIMAVREVMEDDTINNDASCSLVRGVLHEGGWSSG
jgi:hypothetical protein